MSDIQNVHDSCLTYSTYASNGRCTEHSCFMVDVQGTPALRKMVRTPKLTKHRQNYLSAIGINFPLLLRQPSSKLRKTLISILRIRILGFHDYGITPLQPYWAMTLLVTLAFLLGNGYPSKVYTTSWTYSVGTKRKSKLFLPSRYTPLMTMVRVYTLGSTKLNKCVVL